MTSFRQRQTSNQLKYTCQRLGARNLMSSGSSVHTANPVKFLGWHVCTLFVPGKSGETPKFWAHFVRRIVFPQGSMGGPAQPHPWGNPAAKLALMPRGFPNFPSFGDLPQHTCPPEQAWYLWAALGCLQCFVGRPTPTPGRPIPM